MHKVMLVIMDGIGINPNPSHNAVTMAKKPFLDDLWARYPTTRIRTSGEDVGLPPGVMGNSEVGHTNIGAGRVVFQPLARIDKSIREGEFLKNVEITRLLDGVRKTGGALHLMGLLSTGGVHGDIRHVEAILECCRRAGVSRVLIHAFMDGRDMPPRSGIELIRGLEVAIAKSGVGRIATVSGRYWAMDRDKRWERIKKAFDVVVRGVGPAAGAAEDAVRSSYEKDVTDEFIDPVVIGEAEPMRDGDAIFFWNFRPDRARQITRAIMDPAFKDFDRGALLRLSYLGMVKYDESFPLPIAFSPTDLSNVLAEVISKAGLRQFHTAETEKYAHVTFFLNGGREELFRGEDRKLVPSPKVATYDLQPEMSARGVSDAVLGAIEAGHDFIVANYANGDMVGHTGSLSAAIQSVETVSMELSRILPPFLAKGGVAIVTADHGNAEQMIWYETGEPHTQHTTFDVTLTVCGAGDVWLRPGPLADIAPTVLSLMGVEKPAEMTGESLITA